jgi:hypothetical protein
MDAGAVKGEIVACDATFIKASVTQRMTLEAIAIQMLGLEGLRKAIGSGYHLAVDASSDLPLAVTAAPANENEKKHAPKLIEKAIQATDRKVRVGG